MSYFIRVIIQELSKPKTQHFLIFGLSNLQTEKVNIKTVRLKKTKKVKIKLKQVFPKPTLERR